MNWIDATINFNSNPADNWWQEYVSRYSVDGCCAVHWDDAAHTRRRDACINAGTIVPIPFQEGDEPEFGEPDNRPVIGYTIACGWPERFILDLRENAYPDFFEGITEITEE